MGFIPLASSRTTMPMLLGTYECELNPAVETICEAGCDRIIDIGAAEGYYAVGMALRNPGVPLVGFEMNASVRYYLRRLARRNGVRPRIKILGECTPPALRDRARGGRAAGDHLRLRGGGGSCCSTRSASPACAGP